MPARSDRNQDLLRKRLEIAPEMNRALQRQNLLLLRFDAEMPEGCLVERLHALRRHCDLDAPDLEQGHRSQIDIAIAGNRPGRSDLAVAELLDVECAAK